MSREVNAGPPPPPVRIVSAALRKADGLIFSIERPARHDAVIKGMIQAGAFAASAEQGFLTSDGRFVDRAEAERIARVAGQIRGPTIRGGVLTTEDLW